MRLAPHKKALRNNINVEKAECCRWFESRTIAEI